MGEVLIAAARRARSPRERMLIWWGSMCRLRRRFRSQYGAYPRLLRPRTQSERIQHRKLFQRDPRMPVLQDKRAVKGFVAATVGPEYLVPTLWAGTSLPPRRQRDWPRPFVLKATHGSAWTVHVPAEGSVRWGPIERKVQRWLDSTYGERAGEWLYSQIPSGLLVEPHLGDPDRLPDDFKFFVYHGRVHYIYWITGRGTSGYGGRTFDRDWNEAFEMRHIPVSPMLPPRPQSLDTMIWLAERLAQDWPFVRIDLYEVDGRPYFGEFTFYPTSGFQLLHPPGTDRMLGDLWRHVAGDEVEARQGRRRRGARVLGTPSWASPRWD